MSGFTLIIALGFAAIDWWAVFSKNRALEKYSKPLTMIMLILWVIIASIRMQLFGENPLIWLLVGLSFCLIGDILLFLPPEQWFVKGLIAFLLGHVSYIISFGVFEIYSDRLFPALMLSSAILIASLIVVKRLIRGLLDSDKGNMVGPIVLYAVIISFMLFSAGYKLLDFDWSTIEATLVAGGALLFYISDILNAWERFVSKFNHDRFIIMLTYHLGQFGIATGMVLHLSSLAGI